MEIERQIDVKNLVRELAENKTDSLEAIREAFSNSKDHGAKRIWLRTSRNQRNSVSIVVVDDGEGMTTERLKAFWGVGASSKEKPSIGYKGHGSKLFFYCDRLTVATRAAGDAAWRISLLERPFEQDQKTVSVRDILDGDEIKGELGKFGLLDHTGTAIIADGMRFADADSLLSRRRIESFCDWFTVVGDIRSGLFDTRLEFHKAVKNAGGALEALQRSECDLRILDVQLRINGERDYTALGFGPSAADKELYSKWPEDVAAHRNTPGLVIFGHRFADVHEATGATRVRDDLTALRLTGPDNWTDPDGISIVIRVEGHRRQRQTYTEASWQGHQGLFSFENRFGLWLCRDFIPIVQNNDVLREALQTASKGKLHADLSSLRNWQVFVNWQQFLPTANRNGVSNLSAVQARLSAALERVLGPALKNASFQEWVGRLRKEKLDRRRDQEVKHMDNRLQETKTWVTDKNKTDAIDPAYVAGLDERDSSDSLLMKAPTSEQELFYVYGLLSAKYEMPLQVLEYDTSEGVDAIARVRVPELIVPRMSHARVEFKYEISANNPIDHFFDSIDAIVCWRVLRTGDIYENSAGEMVGKLSKRKKSVLSPPVDTHQIEYENARQEKRVIPIIQIAALFPPVRSKRG